MEHAGINKPIDAFKSAVDKRKKIVGFTGAGISTESGIPDYRNKDGIWDKFQPVYFEEFISDEKKRLLYRKRKQELWKDLSTATPNKGRVCPDYFINELNVDIFYYKIVMGNLFDENSVILFLINTEVLK